MYRFTTTRDECVTALPPGRLSDKRGVFWGTQLDGEQG
jgi:hypothetical protein